MGLTPGMERQLLQHGDPSSLAHLGTMRALAKRGLVIEQSPGEDCRLWCCWPLTPAGVAARAALSVSAETEEA